MKATAKCGLTLPLALLLLTACASDPEIVYRDRVVTKHVPQYREIPAELTEPVLIPEWPEGALRNRDLADWIEKAKARFEAVNADLLRVRELSSGDR